jgi:hypothetical protein
MVTVENKKGKTVKHGYVDGLWINSAIRLPLPGLRNGSFALM